MIVPQQEKIALEQWALDELKNVGKRASEFAKFFFAISAGSFGIVAFFDKTFSVADPIQLIGLLAIGCSAVLATRMIEPADFAIRNDTVLSFEHSKFAARMKRQRRLWLVSWLVGVESLFVGLTVDFQSTFCIEI